MLVTYNFNNKEVFVQVKTSKITMVLEMLINELHYDVISVITVK